MTTEQDTVAKCARKLRKRATMILLFSIVLLLCLIGVAVLFILLRDIPQHQTLAPAFHQTGSANDASYVAGTEGVPQQTFPQSPQYGPAPWGSVQPINIVFQYPWATQEAGKARHNIDSAHTPSNTATDVPPHNTAKGMVDQYDNARNAQLGGRNSNQVLETSSRVSPKQEVETRSTKSASHTEVPNRPLSFAERIHMNTSEILTDQTLRETEEEAIGSARAREVSHYIKEAVCGLPQSCDTIWKNYQSFDGSCNNFEHPRWGSANSCFKRILNASYADGVSEPRRNSASPTLVSLQLQSTHTSNIPKKGSRPLNLFLMSFMQFVTHDIASTVSSKPPGGNCCQNPSAPECTLAIDTKDDPFYASKDVTCINFVRSARCPCSQYKQRDQLNSVSAYLDLTPVYGRTVNESFALRDTNQTYLLATSENGLPPFGGGHCRESGKCFRGDSKMSQQHALSVVHIIFLRYHNILATSLKKKNPDWTDDIIYLTARRTAIFHYQVIIFRELLPVLLGEEACRCLMIHFEDLVNGTKYDSAVEAGVYNEFATAVFRAHTLIPNSLGQIAFKYFNSEDFKNISYVPRLLEELFKTPTARGFPATESAVHHALDQRNGSFGLNMIALNIQRGRDHGLAPYVDYVGKRLGLEINSFSDLVQHGILPLDRINLLREIYRDARDIDLFIGKDLETKPLSGVLGMTFEDIIARQFRELAMRDRYFFSHVQKEWTVAQLDSWQANVDTAWMSYILCKTVPEVGLLPKSIMNILAEDNMASCRSEVDSWIRKKPTV